MSLSLDMRVENINDSSSVKFAALFGCVINIIYQKFTEIMLHFT